MAQQTMLSEITLSIEKVDPRKAPTTAFSYIDISAIDQAYKAVKSPTRILGADAPSRARQILEPGDVLVSTVRPNLNAVALVEETHKGAIGSTGFCVLRPDTARLDSSYLFHWVQTRMFVDDMISQASGASYPAVTDRIVRASFLRLPPIEEQRRIAAILDAADALRSKRRQALAKLDTLTQAIFIDMFGDPGSRTDLVPLDEVVSSPITRGIDQPGDNVENGVPYIKTTDFRVDHIQRNQLAQAAADIASKFPRSVVEQGDLVMCIRATVGPVMMIDEQLAGVNLSRGTARIAPDRTSVLPEYLFAALNSSHINHQISGQLRGATFLQIPLKEVRKLRVVVPPMAAQQEFARRTTAVCSALTAQSESIQELDALFGSLQQRAFRGEL